MSACADHHPLPPVGLHHGGTIDQTTLHAFQALARVFHLQRQAMQRRLSSPEAHHGEIFALRLLAATDGMSQRDLAETLHLSRPRVTSILQGLEKAGAVRREPDPADQRVTRVFLTAEGRRREVENRAAFEDYIERTLGRLTNADRLELTRLLNEVSQHIAALVCPVDTEQEGRIA